MAIKDDINFEKRRIFYAAFFPFILIILLWMIWLWELNFHTDLHWLGIYPRNTFGLLGILTEPLIHANAKHLLSNSVPLFVLGWCLFYFYKDLGYAVFPMLWVFSGFITWCIGRESWHIGASGLTYGLSFFLFFSGVFRRYIPLMAISILVVFLYGSTVWYMFPVSELIEKNISWEGHLSGAFSGFLCATLFRKYGPQKPPDPFESEEEEVEEDVGAIDCVEGFAVQNVADCPQHHRALPYAIDYKAFSLTLTAMGHSPQNKILYLATNFNVLEEEKEKNADTKIDTKTQ